MRHKLLEYFIWEIFICSLFNSEDDLKMIGDVRSGRSDEGGVGALGGVEHHTVWGGQPEAATVRVVTAAHQTGGESVRTLKLIIKFSHSKIHTVLYDLSPPRSWGPWCLCRFGGPQRRPSSRRSCTGWSQQSSSSPGSWLSVSEGGEIFCSSAHSSSWRHYYSLVVSTTPSVDMEIINLIYNSLISRTVYEGKQIRFIGIWQGPK